MSCIYFIGAIVEEGKSGAVKIGYTASDPRKRLQKLQIGHPGKLYLVTYIPGTMDDERELHRRFEPYRIRGEWFRYEGAVDEFVWGIIQSEWAET